MSTHSRIGASSYHRWGTCPGSVRLSKGMPRTTSEFAEEGIEAHELAAKLLLDDPTLDLSAYDDEMLEAVDVYVEAFQEASKGASYLKIEEKFHLSELHPDLYGTADGVFYLDDSKTLHVWDYKHGMGIPVEVEHNGQLMYYALGALLKTKLPCSKVKITICQPRCWHFEGPIRSWEIDAIDLLDFAADLVDDAKKTEDPNAILASGDHCRFCPAAPICPLLENTALTAYEEKSTQAQMYDPVKLGQILDKLPAVKAWAKSVEEFAFAEAQRGTDIPGYKLVPRKSHRSWALDPEGLEKRLLLDFGLSYPEIHDKPSIKSPAQVEKLLSKEKKKELERLINKKNAGTTLAKESDKRPQALPSAQADFIGFNELLS
jgi:hypothetical protein